MRGILGYTLIFSASVILLVAIAYAFTDNVAYREEERSAIAQRAGMLWYDASRDPALGTKLILREDHLFSSGSGNPDDSHILVAYVGDCMSCNLVDISLLVERMPTNVSIVLIFDSSEENLTKYIGQKYKEGIPKNAMIVRDASGDYAQLLNSAWLPRLYVFNRQWQLIHAQPANEDPIETIKEWWHVDVTEG